MRFIDHSDLAGKHAFLSASNSSWLRYTDDKLVARYDVWQNAVRGTKLHELAHMAIDLKVKFADTDQTINQYTNDAIGFKMTTEQILYYSPNCYGTADTISFRRRFLRIHDLKTGTHRASMDQLVIYAALFCLEYGERPRDIDIELRIYQNDEVVVYTPDTEEIEVVMERIVYFDKMLERLKTEDLPNE